MLSLNLSFTQLQIFFLIFFRVCAIIMTLPVLGNKNVPVLVKVGLCLSLSILLFPVLKLSHPEAALNIIPFIIGLLDEVVFGIIIGICVKLIFAGIQLAGQLVGFQMGLAIVNIIDPGTSDQIPILAQFNNLMALLIFLAVNAHHWLIRALVESFHLVPFFGFQLKKTIMDQLITFGGDVFIIAIKVAAPVMAALLLTSVALGLIARTVPQMNIFIVAMPVKIFIGLIVFAVTFPYLIPVIQHIFISLENGIFLIMKAI